ncbi:MAG: hypothetical protein LBM92_02750 [Opitutaceae bacterium]|jgi:hypothetical protein|nr:hypothetical protein [Opitutaceae bacterium]
MSVLAKTTAVPAVYFRSPGGAFTPAAALHKIVDNLGSATPWAMLALGCAPRPRANSTEITLGGAPSPRAPQRVVSAGIHSPADSHAPPFAKKSVPLNYAVRYETASPDVLTATGGGA